MTIYFRVKKLTVAISAFAIVISKGPLTINGSCHAFSTQNNFRWGSSQPSIKRSFQSSTGIGKKILDARIQSTHAMASQEELSSTVDTTQEDDNKSPLQFEVSCNHPTFEGVSWEAYETLIEDMLTQRRVVKSCDDTTISKCRTFLLSQEQHILPLPDIVSIVAENSENKKEALEIALREQSTRFRQHFNFSSVESEFINRCLVYMGDACAKEQSKQNRNNGNRNENGNNIDPRLAIAIVWEKAKEMGLVLREKSLSSYMYILSSVPGETEKDTMSDFVDNALLEVVTSYDIIYAPSEKTLTIRFKSLIARGRIDEAERMFAESFNRTSASDESIQGRLRTYMPLMEHYCKVGDLKSTLRIYRQMQDCPGVHWDVESYTILLSYLARFGYFFGSRPIAERDELEEGLYGPKLFDSLVSNMANDILELTEMATVELKDAFTSAMETHLFPSTSDHQSMSSSAVVVERVEVPKESGTCPLSGVKLRLLALDDTQREHVHDTLLEMSRKNTEDFLASNIEWQQSNKAFTPTNTDNIEVMTSKMEELHGYKELRKFSEWLNNREGTLFTTIVDGPNVAYYGHSNVHYSSLKKVVEKLESMGERPLVVMPEKYTWKKFYVRPRYYQKLSPKDLEVIEWLREKEILYVVPRFVLDDYFWMLASVSNQTNATQRGDLSIPVGDDQGRFPGMRPMLITNDQMRDHKLDLLQPREFRRWCSCHIVNYDIGEYVEDEWDEDREITLVPADSFSREIQSNPHTSGRGNVWHFPVGDSNSTEWLCISIEA